MKEKLISYETAVLAKEKGFISSTKINIMSEIKVKYIKGIPTKKMH